MQTLAILLFLMAAPLDDLKALKQLPPVPTVHLWPTPKDANFEDAVEIARITGSAPLMAEDTKTQIQTVLNVRTKAQSKRTPGSPPVALTVTWRPWIATQDVMADAVWAEFGKANQYARNLKAAGAGPPYLCLVDSEGLTCNADPQRARCVDLYETYDLFIRSLGCTETIWYGFGALPAPAEPDEFGYHAFAAPFPGMSHLGFEVYYLGEAQLRRESSRRARTYANSLGVQKTAAWISAPGSGRVFKWTNAAYSDWSWEWLSTVYDTQLGRELVVPWYRARPSRYSDPVNAICVYPSPLDSRLREKDPELMHLLAFLRGCLE